MSDKFLHLRYRTRTILCAFKLARITFTLFYAEFRVCFYFLTAMQIFWCFLFKPIPTTENAKDWEKNYKKQVWGGGGGGCQCSNNAILTLIERLGIKRKVDDN